ncbi:MAG: hypothetical protein JST04_15820 [Bdellovibrionales bacterium]|nr:hypothetical protein [Bdellovibrionales bacterium]
MLSLKFGVNFRIFSAVMGITSEAKKCFPDLEIERIASFDVHFSISIGSAAPAEARLAIRAKASGANVRFMRSSFFRIKAA